jgi:hypothetical protein
MESSQNNISLSGDLLLTDLQGNKILVNSFKIACAWHRAESTVIMLDVHVASGSTSKKVGYEVSVKETPEEIYEMKSKLFENNR